MENEKNIPQIEKVFKDFIGQDTNPNRIYMEQNVGEDGTPVDTGNKKSFRDITEYQQIGDLLDSNTLNGFVSQLNAYSTEFDVMATSSVEDYNQNAEEKTNIIDEKITLVNMMNVSDTTIENTIIVANNIPLWTPADGGIISINIPSGMAVATKIRINNVEYPLFTTSKEQVRDLKEGVTYLFAFGGGSFFINSGSSNVEVGSIINTDLDYTTDDRYVELPYTITDNRLIELLEKYPLNSTISLSTPISPYKNYLKKMNSSLPDGESFTPNDGSFNDWVIGTEYWFNGGPAPNIDLGRNDNGTYKIGEFVLCNGQSIETYPTNQYSSKTMISVPNKNDLMYEHTKVYKLVERDIYLGDSNADPFSPINLSNDFIGRKNGVYFVNKYSLYNQNKYNIHICNGDSTDELLEHNYEFMPNYSTLNNEEVVAVLVDNELELGDYVMVNNSVIVDDNFIVSNGSAISIQDVSYKNKLINNIDIDRLEGNLIVKNETFGNDLINGNLGKCVKLGNYIYTEGIPNSNGFKIIRFDANLGVNSEAEYAPFPNVTGYIPSEDDEIHISPNSICIKNGNRFIFTRDYETFYDNTIVPYNNSWKIIQTAINEWVSWGIEYVESEDGDYPNAFVVTKNSPTQSWDIDTDTIVSGGSESDVYSNSNISMYLWGYSGLGGAVFKANGSRSYYERTGNNSWTEVSMFIVKTGTVQVQELKRYYLKQRSELAQVAGFGFTNKVGFVDNTAIIGGYWYQSSEGWSELYGPLTREYDYNAFLFNEIFNGSNERDYETTESNTMNYKGSFSGRSGGRSVSTEDWYSNVFNDTGTETTTTPMVIAGFSNDNPVMQEFLRLKTKNSNMTNVDIYVKLR